MLERQVVCASCTSFGCRFRLWREWCGGSIEWRHRSSVRLLCWHAINLPHIDLIEPTALILMGVNVERNGQFLSTLYVELLDAILTKYPEANLLGILVVCFDYILLRHPGIT